MQNAALSKCQSKLTVYLVIRSLTQLICAEVEGARGCIQYDELLAQCRTLARYGRGPLESRSYRMTQRRMREGGEVRELPEARCLSREIPIRQIRPNPHGFLSLEIGQGLRL